MSNLKNGIIGYLNNEIYNNRNINIPLWIKELKRLYSLEIDPGIEIKYTTKTLKKDGSLLREGYEEQPYVLPDFELKVAFVDENENINTLILKHKEDNNLLAENTNSNLGLELVNESQNTPMPTEIDPHFWNKHYKQPNWSGWDKIIEQYKKGKDGIDIL